MSTLSSASLLCPYLCLPTPARLRITEDLLTANRIDRERTKQKREAGESMETTMVMEFASAYEIARLRVELMEMMMATESTSTCSLLLPPCSTPAPTSLTSAAIEEAPAFLTSGSISTPAPVRLHPRC